MRMGKRQQNNYKGAELENPVHATFKQLGWNVEPHKVTDSGVDSKAFKDGKCAVSECLNWYGGFIHPKRWLSIIDNLMSHPSASKYLICVGVYPTSEQHQDLLRLGIHLVHADTIADCTRNLRNQISGVITVALEAELEPVSYEIPYSSIDAVELDMWRPIYSDLFSD